MKISFDRGGVKSAQRTINKIAERSKNLTPVWPKVGSYMAASNRRQFSSHGAYYGTPWAPLKPEYAAWKISHSSSRKLLVLSGGLRASLVSRPMNIEHYSAQTAEFGTDHWLSKFHHPGTHRNGQQANPPRPLMKKTPKMTNDVGKIVRQYVLSGKVGSMMGMI